jgi:hypothetical protein
MLSCSGLMSARCWRSAGADAAQKHRCQMKPATKQRVFATPDEAVKALVAAARGTDAKRCWRSRRRRQVADDSGMRRQGTSRTVCRNDEAGNLEGR